MITVLKKHRVHPDTFQPHLVFEVRIPMELQMNLEYGMQIHPSIKSVLDFLETRAEEETVINKDWSLTSEEAFEILQKGLPDIHVYKVKVPTSLYLHPKVGMIAVMSRSIRVTPGSILETIQKLVEDHNAIAIAFQEIREDVRVNERDQLEKMFLLRCGIVQDDPQV